MAMAAAALVPVSAAAAAPAWSIVPSGNAPAVPTGGLVTVACPSAATCFALGSYGNVSASATMMQQWNGSRWTLASAAPLPGPAGATGPYLSDLECVSETFCVVAGLYQVDGISHPLAERWDGSAWNVMSIPDVTGLSLSSVACPSETSCFATGYGTTYPQKTFVEHWDGNAWAAMSTPNIANTDSSLSRIACASATLCFAVGTAGNGPVTPRTLVEQWDGTSWTIVASPNPSGTNLFPFLTDVACPSATACYAVGNYTQGRTEKTIIERWDGAKWSMVTSPDVEGDITGLACPTAANCFAVGPAQKGSNGALHSVALRGGTGSWSTVAYGADEPGRDIIRDVACASPSTCFAVGYNGSKNPVTIEQWNGTAWTNLTVPQPSLPDSTLSDVACAGTVCFAVGHSEAPLGHPTNALIARQTPSGWKVVTSPSPKGGQLVTLTGISCPTPTLCFAAGHSDQKTLIERWNGKAWSIVPSPNNPQWGGQLTDVSCASAKFCFAVGSFPGETIETLTERWDGATWKIVPSPSRRPSPQFETEGVNNLQSVSCASATSCVAVGNDAGYLYDFTETLAEHWNGSKWAIVKSPNPAKFSNLAAVSCVAAKNCYAVGNATPSANSTATMQTLIVHWNGSVWTRATSADPTPAPRNTLLGVSCPSATSCVAVGDSRTGGVDHTLVKRLSGNKWSIEPSPDPAGAIQASLHSVGCTSAAACVAVGDSTGPQTLVEQYR